MAPPLETGNPVFDYRAGFRRGAGALQSLLICAGLLVFVVAGILWLATTAVPPRWSGGGAVGGAGCALAGLIWGFYWRNSMREEFQRKFGAETVHSRDAETQRPK